MKRFPKVLESFRKLEGGKFGYLDVIARNRGTLELALGDDFVRFSRKGVADLALVLGDWLEDSSTEETAEHASRAEAVVIAETAIGEAMRPARARGRGRRADAD